MALPSLYSYWARASGGLAAGGLYLEVRSGLARAFDERGLDDLLLTLGVPGARVALPLPDLACGVTVAELLFARAKSGPNTCLFRALARYAVLVRFGYSPAFVLGMRETGELPAHAWVELDGRPFLEPGPLPFRSVYRYPKGA